MPPYIGQAAQAAPVPPVPVEELLEWLNNQPENDGRGMYSPRQGRCYEIPDVLLVGRGDDLPTPERPIVLRDVDNLPPQGPFYLGKYGVRLERAEGGLVWSNRNFENNSTRMLSNQFGEHNINWDDFIRVVPCHDDDEPMMGGRRYGRKSRKGGKGRKGRKGRKSRRHH